jgi:cell division septum initiation protein DivIVA
MMKNKEIVIKDEVSPITKVATDLKIKTADDMSKATEILSKLNKQLDRVIQEKEKVTKPLNEALKAERSRWKPIETTIESAINDIRQKMSVYQTKLIQEARAKEAKIAEKMNDGKLSIEKAVEKFSSISKPDEKVSTDSGSVSFRTDKILKITSIKDIPDMYWIVDESLILADLKAGKQIKGACIEEIQVPINRR